MPEVMFHQQSLIKLEQEWGGTWGNAAKAKFQKLYFWINIITVYHKVFPVLAMSHL